MSELDSANGSKPAADAPERSSKRKGGKTVKSTKKSRAKKAGSQPKGDRANKKAEVIAMMKRAKGATLVEIMEAMVC
jgi:hypothetical protein